MNLFEVSEHLRDYSQSQLMSEMQNPTGSAPQYLIMSELQRRNRIKQQAAQGPTPTSTVADDVVNAAGVPAAGIAGMANAMAPGTDVAMNSGQGSVAQAPPVRRMQAGGLAEIDPDVMAYGVRSDRRDRRDGGNRRESEERVGGGPYGAGTMNEFGGLTVEQSGGYDADGNWVGQPDMPRRTIIDSLGLRDAVDAIPGRRTEPEILPMTTGTPLDEVIMPPASQTTSPEDGSTGSGGAADPMTAASDRVERQNRWLALARFGLGLASSNAPTFGQAAGEAGLAALDYMAGMDQQDRENAMAERELAIRQQMADANMLNATRPRGGGSGDAAMVDPADLLKYREQLTANLLEAATPAQEMAVQEELSRVDAMLGQLLGVAGPATQRLEDQVDIDFTQR